MSLCLLSYIDRGVSVVRLLQNILVRRYLQIRAARKAQEKEDDDYDTAADRRNAFKRQTSTRFRRGKSDLSSMESSNNSADTRTKDKRGRMGKRKQKKGSQPKILERQPFSSDRHKSVSASKNIAPRGVAVPYSRLKKDRFFDWPPDPTVSRATAIGLVDNGPTDNDSLSSSLPDVNVPPTEGLRQRKPTGNKSDSSLPTNIAF